MLKFYLNRDLSRRLGIPLSRWKRWSREFLPPDPLGGHQSGYARQYSTKDAFLVYLAGFLVSTLGFSIPAARQILQDLNPWLKKNILENGIWAVHPSGDAPVDPPCVDLIIIPAQRKVTPAFTYRIRCRIERKALSEGEITLWQEQFTEQVIKPGEPLKAGCYPACARRVDLSAVAEQFFAQLSSNESKQH
jgi:hypothetical protein